jgi:hypothetical protein
LAHIIKLGGFVLKQIVTKNVNTLIKLWLLTEQDQHRLDVHIVANLPKKYVNVIQLLIYIQILPNSGVMNKTRV